MTPRFRLLAVALALIATTRADDFLDRVDQALTWSSANGEMRARVSGLVDLEAYALPDPPPGVIDAEDNWLFNPRLSAFLDAQLGSRLYGFAQARVDRGFDPANDPLRARLDEYALRWAADPGAHVNLQFGKFATIVGNWTQRHDSWTNPFITAPLPYENLTGVWDSEPPHSTGQLLLWSHAKPGLPPAIVADEKYVRVPIIWGPSYATGFAVAGEQDKLRYAVEVKSASLSSRPEVWTRDQLQWDHPTVSARVRYSPDERWEFGCSASSGSFLRPSAGSVLTSGIGRGDYREVLFGQDLTFAWHHFQLWAEVFEVRFDLPGVARPTTVAYYVEAKYKFAPQWSGAIRWNQQLFGSISDRGVSTPWERDVARLDIAPAFRLTPHVQIKLQYSVEQADRTTQLLALQSTIRF